ncbi:hypothetical protein ES703_74221 [subsurface metagenome]
MAKEPLYPHVPKSRKQKAGTEGQSTKKLTRNDVEVYLSLPPYRASLWVENKETGETIWKVEGAESISRFGWKDLTRDQLEERVLKHLEDSGTLASVSSEVKANYYFCDNTRLHSNNEVIQIKTEEENPKCPYCGAVMTYGRYWGPLLATL